MKEFAPAQIESTKKYFIDQKFPIEEAMIGDLDVSYWVISQTLNPGLQDFAFRMTATNPETEEIVGIFGVSDSVPKELRPYWAAHEIIEFTQIGINKKGRCALAEERVVGLVPQDLRNMYIGRRIAFFSHLIDFFREDIIEGKDNYTEDDIHEAEASLAFLKDTQRKDRSIALGKIISDDELESVGISREDWITIVTDNQSLLQTLATISRKIPFEERQANLQTILQEAPQHFRDSEADQRGLELLGRLQAIPDDTFDKIIGVFDKIPEAE